MSTALVCVIVVLGVVVVGGTCASPAGARVCHRSSHSAAQALPSISVVQVKAMSCRQGVRVMRRVAPALSTNYYERLGKTRNRLIAGYRCSGYLIGDAAWRITCHRGHRVVTGLTAE
jgi:hypothetical protein